MTKALLAAALAVVAIGTVGCDRDKGDDELASMELNITLPPDFSDNSVRLCGWRSQMADEKYVCNNYLLGNTEADKCGCFNFLQDGRLEDPNHENKPFQVKNLCPTKDLPNGTWEFTYEVFVGEDCPQPTVDMPETILNPLDPGGEDQNPHNFACYDADREQWLDSPNRTLAEELKPGCNFNEILCITENATKIFNFDVCHEIEKCVDIHGDPCECQCRDESGVAVVDETGVAVMCEPLLKLDCGCRPQKIFCPYPDGDAACFHDTDGDGGYYKWVCNCDGQDLDPMNPPYGCTIRPHDFCQVRCY